MGTTNGVIAYSTDAKTWNYQAVFSTDSDINAIAYNGTTWVVAGANNLLFSGTPGGTWTARTSQLVATMTIYDVKWVGGSVNLFVLIGDKTGATANIISTSPDGITWTARYTSASNARSLAVNTAQNVIIVATSSTTTNQQAVYSSNGTSWTFAPAYNAAAGVGVIWYMPHVDKFAMLGGNLARRASASVGTQWDTVTWERQGRFSTVAQNSSTSTYMQRNIPIWDSVNSKYYVADVSSNNGQFFATLTTLNSSDLLMGFNTGSYNRYGFGVDKIESLPVSLAGGYPSGVSDQYSPPSLGYGNGIWVAGNGSGSWFGDNNEAVQIFSTAV
jgi:hypothetical protein